MTLGIAKKRSNGLYVSVDWLSFTLKDVAGVPEVLEMFGLNPNEFQTGLSGAYGYKARCRHIMYGVSILHDGMADMGVHVDVSGSAIPFFVNCFFKKKSEVTPFGDVAFEISDFDLSVFADLLQVVMDVGQLTRLDLAIDDFGCYYFSMDFVQKILEDGNYTSKFRKMDIQKEFHRVKGRQVKTGHTIYLGSRMSDMLIRMYDKQLEQIQKKKECPDPWMRWEMELHDRRADAAALFLIGGMELSELVLGLLSNYVRLIDRSVNDNTTRCPNLPEWDMFLDAVSKVTLWSRKEEKTMDEKKEWLMKQAAPTIAAIYECDGDLSFFYSLIEAGSTRLSASLVKLIMQAEKEWEEKMKESA